MAGATTNTGMAGETIVIDETKLRPFQVEVKAGTSTFLMDEPVAAGGGGSGPNPYDLLSAAIGACSLMTLRLYADRKKWPLERVRLKVTHHRDGLHGKDRFVREIELIGPLDETQRARLLEISTHCPVHLTLERGSEIETVLTRETMTQDNATTLCDHMRDMQEACGKA
jgi:putative redox protein